MFKAMSAKHLLILVALLAAMGMGVMGCGQNENTSAVDGIIHGGDDGMVTGKTPEIALLKTIVTRGTDTDTSFHFEANMILEQDLVVGVRIKEGSEVENAILVMPKGTEISEAFSFDTATEITIVPHKDLLDYKWPMQAMNSEPFIVSIDYPLHQRAYTISANDQTVLASAPIELRHLDYYHRHAVLPKAA